MVYGYIRVSTDRQTTENQRFEIENFAKRNNIKINVWIEETISGVSDYKKRKLGKLLNILKGDDLIIVSEISRLGRNLLQVMAILHHVLELDAKIWTIKDNYRLGCDIQSKVLAFAFSLSAEIERSLISQRTKEALARLKAEGKVLGRPSGRVNSKLKLSDKIDTIKEMLIKGRSKTAIARKLKVSRNTVSHFIKRRF